MKKLWICLFLIAALTLGGCSPADSPKEKEMPGQLTGLIPEATEDNPPYPVEDYRDAIVGGWVQMDVDSSLQISYSFTDLGSYIFVADSAMGLSGTYRFDGDLLILRDEKTRELVRFRVDIRQNELYMLSSDGILSRWVRG